MLKKIDINKLEVNVFESIGKNWMLVTAGNEDTGSNTLTASWGGLGVLWNKNVATIYIRPQRYTKVFIDNEEYFTLSFFEDDYKKTLGYLGRVSGRDEDKIKKVGLNINYEDNVPYFKEAKLVLICKKLYHAPILEEGFVVEEVSTRNYPEKDFHEMYIGEIVSVLTK